MKEKTPTCFVILGVTGDLAQKKLFPALLDLYAKDVLPSSFHIIGFSRREMRTEEFRDFVKEAISKKNHGYSPNLVEKFLSHLSYVQGLFDDLSAYKRLASYLSAIDMQLEQCSNKLFYLSVPPTLYEMICTNLSKSGLMIPCGGGLGWARLLIEKPFGKDIETARMLDGLLGQLFQEEQIFRIDHYLAKETMQNILAFRFSNTLFEPLWNNKHIQSVEINLYENVTVGSRGAFYDPVGALRDVGQNHILQMLALVAMEKPASSESNLVRTERAHVLQKLKKISDTSIAKYVVRARYEGYETEAGVPQESQTETFFSIEAHVDNKRWKGVPFYLTSGKALKESKVEIKIHFNDTDPTSFLPPQYPTQEHNTLTFRIQPDEGISLLFWVKAPGFETKIEPKELSFKYADHVVKEQIPDAYEKVLFDCIKGDQTLFTTTDEVLAEWEFITPILKSWNKVPLRTYAKGSEGPTPPVIPVKTGI